MKSFEKAWPCSASKCLFEVSDWTLAAGAVLETVMQHQKCSALFHAGGGSVAQEHSEVASCAHVDGQKFKFPTFEDLSEPNCIKRSGEIRCLPWVAR